MKLLGGVYNNWAPFGASVFRQMGVFRDSLSLDWLFFRCLQLRTINIQKWQIWGWHILVPFRRKMGGRKEGEIRKEDRWTEERRKETWSLWCLAGEVWVFRREDDDQCHSHPEVEPGVGSVEWPGGCPPILPWSQHCWRSSKGQTITQSEKREAWRPSDEGRTWEHVTRAWVIAPSTADGHPVVSRVPSQANPFV